jgi:two-component system nitrogen regulation sensor histidine kinase NtrY
VKANQRDNTRALFHKLINSIHKAKSVLKDFRKFTSPLELRYEKLDLIQLVKEVLGEIQHTLDFPVELASHDEPLAIPADPLKLSDAFHELIKNAKEAMQKDTGRPPLMTITLRTEVVPNGPGIVAWIEFANTGPSISEEDKERIFEPHFTTKGEGSGLGLAIVRKIIEEHKGTIEEIGMPEEGARFVVRLPTSEPNSC